MRSSYNFGNDLPIVQKFIQGEGAGFFAFYKNGQCINYFMHKRIREYPPKGGASVVAESFYDSQILSDGIKILNELKWEGVAMVEFKKDNITNTFNLMEINAKFWGSLDLALVCGANFPQMMIDDALGNKFEPWNLKNKRFQWLLNGDLYYLVERPLHILKFIRELLFSKNDIWISDLAPNIYQLFYIPVHFYKKWFK
jgi:predicted ATP-grasp superfamily ATP-dependent carboligase